MKYLELGDKVFFPSLDQHGTLERIGLNPDKNHTYFMRFPSGAEDTWAHSSIEYMSEKDMIHMLRRLHYTPLEEDLFTL
jgi:hypothetical protein